MAYERRDIEGGAILLKLAATMTAAATSFSTKGTPTGWPDGSGGNFLVGINKGQADAEKILCSARVGSNFTVATGGRGYDGTTAVSHAEDANVEHVFGAIDANEANYAVSETVGKVTAAGDLLVADAVNSLDRLAAAAASGALLVSDTALAKKMAWLAKGADGALLVAGASTLAWRMPTGATVAANETTTSTSLTDLATPGPAVTVTTGTTALVFYAAKIYQTGAAGYARASFAVSGATTRPGGEADAIELAGDPSGIRLGAFTLLTGLTAGLNTFTMKYLTTAGTGGFLHRHIAVL